MLKMTSSPVAAALGGITVLALSLGGITTAAASESAWVELDNAGLEWGLSGVYQDADDRGAICAYFSAGKLGDFSPRVGDVQILKRGVDGEALPASKGSICAPVEGDSNNQRALFMGGEGMVNRATGEATIYWEGAFTANAYAGAVPWWIADPALEVHSDGTGVLTATVGGRGASMSDPDNGFELTPRSVTLATFSHVEVDEEGITFEPDFIGVDYFPLATAGAPEGGRGAVSAIDDRVKQADAGWGAWPTSLVDFHYESGLASYWHTSGGSADALKAPLPVTVSFDADVEIVGMPTISAQPESAIARPFIEGSTVEIVADAEGADAVFWQEAPSPQGPWQRVTGAASSTLTIADIDARWNGKFVRLVAQNAAGETASVAFSVSTVAPVDVTIATQPHVAIAIDGSRPQLRLAATGTPAPSSFVVEQSRDGGATWAPRDGVAVKRWQDTTTLTLAPAVLDESGTLLRVTVENSIGSTATTHDVPFEVVAATGKPQVVVGQSGPLDPTQPNTITVTGAGYSFPAPTGMGAYSLDVHVLEDAAWQPGQTGDDDSLVAAPENQWAELYHGSMPDGSFTSVIEIPAHSLDPTQNYGVGTFLKLGSVWGFGSTFDNRSADAFARIAVQPPSDFPAAVAEGALDDTKRGSMTAEIDAERVLDVVLPEQLPGTGAALSAVPADGGPGVALGWITLSTERDAKLALPEELGSGEYRIAAQGVDGALLGWAEVTVPTRQKPGEGTDGPGSGSGTSGTAPGQDGSGQSGVLALTGASPWLALLLGAGLFGVGASVVVRARGRATRESVIADDATR